MRTLIAFAKWNASGDVIAICPEEPADIFDAALCYSYEHIGQSGALRDTVYEAEMSPATPEEYRELLDEVSRVWDLQNTTLQVIEASPDLFRKYHFIRYARIWERNKGEKA